MRIPLGIGLITALLLAVACGSAAWADNRICTITVDLKSAAGTPVPGVLVICQRRVAASEGVAGLVDTGCSTTDAGGRVSWRTPIPEGAATVYFLVSDRCDSVDRSQFAALGQSYEAALTASHFDARYSAQIAADATSLSYTITGTPPIKVKARSPQNGETGALVTVFEARTAPPVLSRFDKVESTILGVERGHAALVIVRTRLTAGVRMFELTSEQTQADVDLGVIEPQAEGMHECTIRVLDRREAVRRPEITIPSVTVFSEDGAKAWTYEVFGSRRVGHANGVSPRLDPGRYAIVPGMIDGDALPARILGEIRRTKLIPAGIPVLTVTAAGPNTLEVSLAPVIDIGMAFPAFP